MCGTNFVCLKVSVFVGTVLLASNFWCISRLLYFLPFHGFKLHHMCWVVALFVVDADPVRGLALKPSKNKSMRYG